MLISGTGRLYNLVDEGLITTVDYRLYLELSADGRLDKWSGELVLSDSRRIHDGSSYIIELDDERKGRCTLRKKVNKATVGVPPRYFYHVVGSGSLT